MEITGKIIAVLPVRSGTSAKGTQWQCASYVIETQEQYPKKMCFDVFGDRINEFHIMPDETLTVSFEVDARQSGERWFNSIRAWKVERPNTQTQPYQQPPQQGWQPPVQQPPFPPAQPAANDNPPF